MHRAYFLVATALLETVTGVLLLALPGLPLSLLLGSDSAPPELLVCARVAGAALVSLGVACWLERDRRTPPPRGLLTGVLLYDVLAALVLAYAGWFVGLAGMALWPAVAIHTLLAVWGARCLSSDSPRPPAQPAAPPEH
jgi:hypothetical protein